MFSDSHSALGNLCLARPSLQVVRFWVTCGLRYEWVPIVWVRVETDLYIILLNSRWNSKESAYL